MKALLHPLSSWTPSDVLRASDICPQDLPEIARNLMEGGHPGVLATVDRWGHPHVRWMATISADSFPLIHALTAPKTRKLYHLADNPAVMWMFSNQDLSFVLNLWGQATLVRDVKQLKQIWLKIPDKTQAYFLDQSTERPGVAVIETTVERVEISLPQSGCRLNIDLPETSFRTVNKQGQ